ncbi:amiloride-sensitive sodium channel domain-containing protein [Phthorimaea operculella]|nr:amiloride-sensitive sodium channel domain-containing protein [Phthorimaea operculella]
MESSEDSEEDRQEDDREKLSIEMILRRSFSDSFKDYIHNCSLAGAKQMCDPTIGKYQRLVWTVVFLTSFATICYFLNFIWNDTLKKPLIVTLESTEYPIANIHFPAVAICNVNRISKKALHQLAIDEYDDIAGTASLEEVQAVLVNLGRLMDYSYNDTMKSNKILQRMINKYRFNTEKMIEIMRKLTPTCEDTLLRCIWAGSIVECDKIFRMRRTANRGYCCTFNYVMNYNLLKPTVEGDILRQQTAGRVQGLNVVLNPQLDDYAYTLSNMLGFDILIFDSMQFADPTAGRVNHRISEPGVAVMLEIKSTKQVATREIRKYSLNTRGCRFPNEMKEVYHGMYSYSTCIGMCRIITIQSLCKCIPFFYAVNKFVMTTPVCTLEDLRCLNKYREKLYYLYPYDVDDTRGLEQELEDSLNCEECYPDCEITKYVTKAYNTPLESPDMEKNMIDLIV